VSGIAQMSRGLALRPGDRSVAGGREQPDPLGDCVNRQINKVAARATSEQRSLHLLQWISCRLPCLGLAPPLAFRLRRRQLQRLEQPATQWPTAVKRTEQIAARLDNSPGVTGSCRGIERRSLIEQPQCSGFEGPTPSRGRGVESSLPVVRGIIGKQSKKA